MRKFCVLRAIWNSTTLMEKIFLRTMILNVIFFLKSLTLIVFFFLKCLILKVNFFQKSMILNVNFFLKSLILNEKNFCKKHNFETEIFRLVRFRINFFTTRQILNWLYQNVSDFEYTSFAEVCQIFIPSSEQGTFR